MTLPQIMIGVPIAMIVIVGGWFWFIDWLFDR